MEISNKTLALLLVAAVVVSLGGTILSLNRLSRLSVPSTGFVTSSGTTSVDVTTQSSIRFAISSVDFGTGSVNTTGGFQNCTLTINSSSTIVKNGCTGFNSTNIGDTFILENDGNTNLNVTLNSTKAASAFIGGTAPLYKYAVSNNETSSCTGTITGAGWTDVATTDPNICTNLTYNDNADTLRIGINITIPYDAVGTKTATFTATGTAI